MQRADKEIGEGVGERRRKRKENCDIRRERRGEEGDGEEWDREGEGREEGGDGEGGWEGGGGAREREGK